LFLKLDYARAFSSSGISNNSKRKLGNKIPDGNFGAKRLGLCYENEHSVNKYHQDTNAISRKHVDFLNVIAAAISNKFPKYKEIEKYLRVNINAGPRTK
jgi:hypothetical protein